MKKFVKYVVAFVVLTVAAHFVTVWLFPDVLMHLAQGRIMQKTGGEYNKLYHGKPNNTSNQVVVMTCPDLLYSFCVYDLEGKALRLRMPQVDTYWSVALYSGDTTNYLTISDRDFGGKPLDLILAGPGWQGEAPPGARVVKTPDKNGLIMLRTLISDRQQVQRFTDMQQQVRLELIGG